MEFGEKLMLLLNEREISQKDFAEKLNIAPTTLNGYIKNNHQPDYALLKRIAFTLNVSIDFLLDYNNSNAALSLNELSLISKIRNMSENDSQIIYELANYIDKRGR